MRNTRNELDKEMPLFLPSTQPCLLATLATQAAVLYSKAILEQRIVRLVKQSLNLLATWRDLPIRSAVQHATGL
jgi:hypothetical protein